MTNPTEPFWTNPPEATTAYPRPATPTWRQQAETLINRIRDWYDALWDLMPAIAAAITLTWLTTTYHR